MRGFSLFLRSLSLVRLLEWELSNVLRSLWPTSWCVFIWLCQCHLKLEKAKGSLSSCFDYFRKKKFHHIVKDANIFHLKLGDSCTPNNFSTSTPPKHTSHHHSQPIVIKFWMKKYNQSITSDQFLTLRAFDI